MTVSVCIPTWNGEKYLAETIHSVLAQTYNDFECLIVDDGSSDGTLDIIHSFNDPRIQLHLNPVRLGIAKNYNRCLGLARGEFICVFQQDDLMLPDNLERKLSVLATDSTISFVHSSALLLTSTPGPEPVVACYAPSDQILDGPRLFRELFLGDNQICNPTVLARREKILAVGGYDVEADYTCDYELWMKMCINQRVGFLTNPYVKYRWHNTNSSHQFLTEVRNQQLDRARREALNLYRLSTRPEEIEILQFALDQIAKSYSCALELERGKAWLEGQMNNWRQVAENVTQELNRAVRDWKEAQKHLAMAQENEERLSRELDNCTLELQQIKRSRMWRWAMKLRSLVPMTR